MTIERHHGSEAPGHTAGAEEHAVSAYTVDGVQLYYEVHGDGPPLLLIHGDYAMLETWLGTIPALMEHFTVIAPERRGHGRSYDGTERFTYELFADDMAALLGHLGLERAVVVGHSGGANTALMMAYKYPDMVEKLVGMSTWFNGAGSTYDHWQATIGGPDPSWLPEEALRYWHLVNPMGAEYFPIFLQKMYDLGEYPTLTPRDLATIRTPILVVAGDRDWMRFDHTLTLFESVWRHPDPAEDARRRQLFIVPGQGHMFPYEKPELVNGVILDFLLER